MLIQKPSPGLWAVQQGVGQEVPNRSASDEERGTGAEEGVRACRGGKVLQGNVKHGQINV